MNTQNTNSYQPRINYWIKAPQVRLILEDGSMHGVVDTSIAIKMAQEAGLDLIEINPKAAPPVARIYSIGKMQYDLKKQAKAAKKNQKNPGQKVLELRPVTEVHDLETKLKSAKDFLSEGHQVKFVVKFRGRELTHKDLGAEKLNWFIEQLKDLIAATPPMSMDGRDMSIIVSPKATK